jgi:hypothetical protein
MPSTDTSQTTETRYDVNRWVLVTRREILHFLQATSDTTTIDQGSVKPLIAPPLFYQTLGFNDLPISALPPDGTPLEITAPVPATRTVGGSSHFEIFRCAREGESIGVRSKFLGSQKKSGKSGDFYLVDIETIFIDSSDLLVAREVATYVKR